MKTTSQLHLFLRLLMPLAGGIFLGDAFPHTFSLGSLGALFFLLLITFLKCSSQKICWMYGLTVYLFFFVVGFLFASRQIKQTEYTFSEAPAVYQVFIQDAPEERENSLLCRSVLKGKDRNNGVLYNSHPTIFLLYFPKDSVTSAFRRGDELLVYTRLMAPANNGNPDEFDYVRYLRRKGVSGTAYVASGHWQVIGHNTSRTLRQRALESREKIVSLYRKLNFKHDELAVLSALTVGDKDELSEDIIETYSITGASHVLALSGLHIGIIYALFWFLFAPLWRRWKCLKALLILFILLFLWGFAFLTGLSSSVIRSVMMFSILGLAGLQSEKPLSLNTLAATALLMLLYNSAWLFDVGFQLSFSAVAAILLFQPKLYGWWPVKFRILRYVWGLITVSIAAQLGTAPLVMFYFSRFSTHFLLTNLWVIPMVTLVLYSAVLLLVLTPFPLLQEGFAIVVKALVHTQNNVLQKIETFPFATVDGIWLNTWEVLLLYLSILFLYRCLVRFTARNVYLFFFALLLVVSGHFVSKQLYAPHPGMVFYNVRGCPVVHCLTNSRRSWVACADSMPDIARLHRTLSPYWRHLGLAEPCFIAGDYYTEKLSVRNRILCYRGKRICFLHNSHWKNEFAAHPLSIDYLYISKGYRGEVRELSSLFSVKTVIFDGSVSAYYRNKIVNQCASLGIPCLSLADKGAFRVPL